MTFDELREQIKVDLDAAIASNKLQRTYMPSGFDRLTAGLSMPDKEVAKENLEGTAKVIKDAMDYMCSRAKAKGGKYISMSIQFAYSATKQCTDVSIEVLIPNTGNLIISR
jgi:hypothetical protein